jgi:hypothetical protein
MAAIATTKEPTNYLAMAVSFLEGLGKITKSMVRGLPAYKAENMRQKYLAPGSLKEIARVLREYVEKGNFRNGHRTQVYDDMEMLVDARYGAETNLPLILASIAANTTTTTDITTANTTTTTPTNANPTTPTARPSALVATSPARAPAPTTEAPTADVPTIAAATTETPTVNTATTKATAGGKKGRQPTRQPNGPAPGSRQTRASKRKAPEAAGEGEEAVTDASNKRRH